jgi:bla regulator protein blaR1
MMNAFLEALVHLCIVVTAAVVVVLACRFALRRLAGASLAYAAWSLVPFAIFVFVIAKSLPTTQLGLPMPAAMQAPAILTSSALNASHIGFDAALGWLAVWLIGMCVTTVWFAMRQYRFVRSLGSLTRDETTATAPIFRATETSAGPLVLGLFRPRIVIPADFYERYSEAEQRLVIAHELAHIRRGDLYANAFSTLLQIVFWFNPLLHWAVSRMRFDQELACDARVLRDEIDVANQTKMYASAVLKTALPAHASPLACHWQSRHPLNERILNMTASKPRRASRRFAQIGLTALIAASCYGAFAFADKTPKPSEGQYRIDITYTGIDSRLVPPLNEQRRTFSLIQDAGKEASFKVGSRNECEFTFSVSPVHDDQARVTFLQVCGGGQTWNPTVITKLGQEATIKVEGTESDGISVSRTLSLVVTSGTSKRI